MCVHSIDIRTRLVSGAARSWPFGLYLESITYKSVLPGVRKRLRSNAPKVFLFSPKCYFQCPDNSSKRLFAEPGRRSRFPGAFAGLKQVTGTMGFGTPSSESDYNYKGVRCCFSPIFALESTIFEFSRRNGEAARRFTGVGRRPAEFFGRESRQMATGDLALGQEQGKTSARERVINDFSINVATVNGSGSQSANSVLLKSIFGMGVPVSGKNLFPSNIAGLPTWYTIRASKDGYVARKRGSQILIALNPETAKQDMLELDAGGAAIYEESFKLEQYRNDVACYPVPFDKITAAICPEAKLRKLVRNMVYVGVAAQLLSIDLTVVESGLKKQFAKKQKVFDLNFGAVKAGFDYAQQKLNKADPYKIERMNQTAGKIIIDGNAACGMGAVFAGVTVVAWYPITPSTSLIEATADLLKKFRVAPEGKATFAVVQAEDELAAIGMVLGAGWAGARSMTSTSGPGISLMAEFAGLGYFPEIPGVIFDVQRTGPSTGMPTRTSQADLLSVAFLSHGDTKHVVLLPGTMRECFEFSYSAFDLAERIQTPVFVLSDLDLGMNNWMSEPFN